MWRSAYSGWSYNSDIEAGTVQADIWEMLAFEHPNVDMSRVTPGIDPDTGDDIFRDLPKFNAEKAKEELVKFQNPFKKFSPVRVSEESGR